MAGCCTSPTSASRKCRPASFRRRTKATCWSTCGCPIRRRWSEPRPSWRRSKRLPAATDRQARGSCASASMTRRRNPRHRPHDHDLRAIDRAKRDRLELRNGVCRPRRVPSSARQRNGRRRHRGQAAGRLLPRSAGSVGRRVRRAAGRWAGQRRRLQSHGPRHGGTGARSPCRKRPTAWPPSGNRAAGTGRPVQRVPLANAADVRRYRSRAVQSDGRAAERSLPHAAALPGRLLHQRLQPVRPHLAGQSARRPAVPPDARAGAATESPQSRRRDGAAGQRRRRQRDRRPGARHSLQRRHRGRGQRRLAARRQLRHGHQDRRRTGRAASCRRA